MHLAVFSSEGIPFLLRWVHLLAGVAWIGLLYYFDFVQAKFFLDATEDEQRIVTQKLLPRELGWFRWAALATFVTGFAMIGYRIGHVSPAVMSTSWGVAISVGALLGTVMLLNVWLVIWPAERLVIAKAKGEDVGAVDTVALANQAFLASRTNTLLSIPTVFFMGAASHLTFFGTPMTAIGLPVSLVVLITAFFEAIPFVGKRGEGVAKMHDSASAVLHAGLALALLFYFILDLML